jgi:hypothetical protein
MKILVTATAGFIDTLGCDPLGSPSDVKEAKTLNRYTPKEVLEIEYLLNQAKKFDILDELFF